MIRALRTAAPPSDYSAPDIATSYIYPKQTLTNTTVRAADVTELRTLIDGLRARVGLAATTFTDPSLTAQRIKAVHITELRNALNQALGQLGLDAPAYSQPAILAGVTKLKVADLQELRDAIY